MNDYPALDDLRADFEHLASFDSGTWNHSSAYHQYLLKHLKQPCRTALEMGCGSGAFARLLVQHSEKVLALDLSPRMIELALDRSRGLQNLDYLVADGLSHPLPTAGFDCVASISTLHHLDLANALARLSELLRPGGVLLVLDLYKVSSVTDHLISSLALPVNLFLRVWHGDIRRKSEQVHKAWAAHKCHERLVTMAQARRICAAILPGARIRRHLLWRYSIIWYKPYV
ncbi:MAG: class I SAM-dependent methyltransferase [Anaerolineae bacterium]